MHQLAETLGPAHLQRLLDTFVDDLLRLTSEIEAAARARDGEDVRRAAHALAGAAASVGAVALERAARCFLAPRQGPYPAELLVQLHREGEETLRACTALSASRPASP
jgi:HPt (histidine-containing phosphotransfer) domain-containing protein